MDLGPVSALQKRRGRRGKSPYTGVRMRDSKWVSEIRVPKTGERIWLGCHLSAEKAARAYDAALYCLKGEEGFFNFPDNKRPDLGDQPVGSLKPSLIQCIAADFSCLDESEANPEPFPLSPLREASLTPEPSVIADPQNINEMGTSKVDGEPYVPVPETFVPKFVPEQEAYFPKFLPEQEPYVPVYVPGQETHIPRHVLEAASGSPVLSQLDEWFSLYDKDWKKLFPGL